MTTPLVRDLRRITAARATARPPRPVERCDLCTTEVPPDHRHLLQLEERQILCACESCFALRSGEPQFRPTGNRVLWLEDFELADDVWAEFGIPIGLAFLFRSTVAQQVVALYPSPAGATESELELGSWSRLVEANPVLETLAADSEALIVNRLGDEPQQMIAPIDAAYGLVGVVKSSWEGITGGAGVPEAVSAYLEALRARPAVGA